MFSFLRFFNPRHVRLLVALLVVAFWSVDAVADPTPVESAATIYQHKCASCHGIEGGGIEGRYEQALLGDESLADLAKRIADTMPEDDPSTCVGDEAFAVARYIHDEFYSYEARLAKGLVAAPRVELTRLTVPQHRNAIADLIGAFTEPSTDKRPAEVIEQNKPGLLGKYFQSKKMTKREKLHLTRVDGRIDFDFGAGSPDEKITPDAFAIVWNGSLTTHDTGYYDFRIHTPNGVRLYLNTDTSPARGGLRDDDSVSIRKRLIDGWVNSGELRSLTGRIFLLGGRRYPIRLEYFKYQEPTASVCMEWKPPHGVWTVLDEQVLSHAPAPRTFVIDTPFPADDRSVGYERGSSVSQAWHTAITNTALATADEVIDRLPKLSGVGTRDKERPAKLANFATRLASTAFRRPLTADEDQLFRTTLFEDVGPETATRRAVLLTLTSPHFLYTDLTPTDQPPTAHTVAARLAFAMWDSLPDAELRRAANEGQLATSEQIESQASRMVADPRTREKMRGFFRHWLELEERSRVKDQQKYPEFDKSIVADLRRSLELFVEQVVWSPSSDYRELLQADYLLLNERLEKIYCHSEQASHLEPASEKSISAKSFQQVDIPSEGRAGILTHPYLLSAFAYHDNTSPIHRGVFLTRNIVGRQLKPPPIAVAFENNAFSPNLTMREKVTELTRDQACQSCHEVINPLGFALENFDAVGRWRSSENNKPIDAQSDYSSLEGTTLTITGPRDIARFAIASPVAQRAFVKQLFQHLVQQNPTAYGPQTIEQLRTEFVADDFHIRNLLVRIATRAAAHNLANEIPSASQP